jgi:hypothetical protein
VADVAIWQYLRALAYETVWFVPMGFVGVCNIIGR